MKKSGFTLAEVLITLGIIGVVAALTAPALVQNAGSAQIGPKLAKAVSTFELANQNMLNERDASTIAASGATSSYFSNNGPLVIGTPSAEMYYLSNLANYMKINYLSEGNDANKYSNLVTDYNGDALRTPGQNQLGNGMVIIQQLNPLLPQTAVNSVALAKDGTLYAVNIRPDIILNRPILGQPQQVTPPHMRGYGTVVIDINGKAEPNKMGRDAFLFKLMADGSLTPYGSNGSWDTGRDKCNASEITTGYTCAASIYENNLKVIYQ